VRKRKKRNHRKKTDANGRHATQTAGRPAGGAGAGKKTSTATHQARTVTAANDAKNSKKNQASTAANQAQQGKKNET
jgi:hypothetical protein